MDTTKDLDYLRAVVAWANSQDEDYWYSKNHTMSAEDIMVVYDAVQYLCASVDEIVTDELPHPWSSYPKNEQAMINAVRAAFGRPPMPLLPRDEVLPIPSAREQVLEAALRMALAWMEEANARCGFDMFTPDHRKLDDMHDERGRVQVGGNSYLNPVFKRIRALVGGE